MAQNLHQIRAEHRAASLRKFQEACNALNRNAITLTEALRRLNEVWSRPIPKRTR